VLTSPASLFLCKPRRYPCNAISGRVWKKKQLNRKRIRGKSLSSISQPWLLVLCWTICNMFQVVVFRANLVQLWGGHIGGVWRRCHTTWNIWYRSFIIPENILDILQHISSGYLSSRSSSILGGPLSTPHNHTDQVWHWKPPDPCTGSYATWRDAIRNWLPFKLTWSLWTVHNIAISLHNDRGQTTAREQLKFLQESFQTGWNHALNNNF